MLLAWPFAVLAHRPASPVIGFLETDSADNRAQLVEAFRQVLKEGGYVEGRDVKIEYRWVEGRYDAWRVWPQILLVGKSRLLSLPVGWSRRAWLR